MLLEWLLTILASCLAQGIIIHPIEVAGREFVDSITGEPFLVKGVDYQPGGSSGYYGGSDPLSIPNICARDVFLFQQLGVNAIRVYTVNPDLNHDECMSMLAAAGIYLILDINSPKVGESLNRYEPWTSYTPQYLQHIFKVVETFSGYNNTLGLFAGNEVINDDVSAANSPHYVRAVVRDVKRYIANNAPRPIPVGYSAADDLRYRVSLAKYLECGDSESAVDFYGVNSYQWCGPQTFHSSGFVELLNDYADYSVPLFLSEYGCNLVLPRVFEEVHSLFSDMTPAFSGGLVYEFTQEPNGYGLVELDSTNTAVLLKDFDSLRKQLAKLVVEIQPKFATNRSECLELYPNMENSKGVDDLPLTFGSEMILNGVKTARRGKYVPIRTMETTLDIFNSNHTQIRNKTLDIPRDWYQQLANVGWSRTRGYDKQKALKRSKQRMDNRQVMQDKKNHSLEAQQMAAKASAQARSEQENATSSSSSTLNASTTRWGIIAALPVALILVVYVFE